MDPKKIEALLAWKPPTNMKKVRSFVGLVGNYPPFTKGLSSIADILTKFLHKGVKFEWTRKYQERFEILKELLIEALILVQPIERLDMWFIAIHICMC